VVARATQDSIFGRPFVKRFALCYQTVVCLSCPVCLSLSNVVVLWPNGLTDQDETWHAGRPRPCPHCVRRGPSSPSPKGAQSPIFGPYPLRPNGRIDQDSTWYRGKPRPRATFVRWGPCSPPQKWGAPPIFGPCLSWPNGWMNQDDTWHGARPQPRRPCGVRWGPNPLPKKGAESPPQSLAHFYCGQTAGCTKMPLGMQLGLSKCDFVLDRDTAPSQKGGGAPQFSAHVYCGQTAGWIKMILGMEVGLSPGDLVVLDGDPAHSPKKGRSPLPNFRQILLCPNG